MMMNGFLAVPILIWICIIAAAALLLYFYMTAGKRQADAAWFTRYKYAHRGLHDGVAPENTLAAFENAAENGYGIELDVRLSKDGQVMVFHDETLGRLTDKQGSIDSYTANELQDTPLLGTAHTIPTLAEVLTAIHGRVPLLIEIKSEGAAGGLEPKLFAMLKQYDGRYAVQSFSPLSLGWFYKHAPDVPRGQLSGGFEEGAEHISGIKRFAVKNLLTNFLCRPGFISYEKGHSEKLLLKRLRKSGLPVLMWVVTDAKEQNKLQNNCDGIIFEGYEPGNGDNI